MKPTLTTSETGKRHANEIREMRTGVAFPKTDSNYQTTTFDLNGRCAGKRRGEVSFREISASYSEREARHGFVSEAAFFALIALITAMALISSAHTWLNLLRSISGV